jgi:hypothetical protein
LAIAAPIPREAPVTKAVFPESAVMVAVLSYAGKHTLHALQAYAVERGSPDAVI